MSQDNSPSIPARSLVYVGSGLVALAVIILLGYLPAVQTERELSDRAGALQADIERQKALKPLFAQLKIQIEQGRKLVESFTNAKSANAALSVNDSSNTLSELAKSNRLPESHFTPAPESMAANDGRLLVNGYVKGDAENFRAFLMALSSAPYFERLQHIEVQRKGGSMEYWLKLWLKLK